MRNPHRWRTIGLWGFGLGALSLALLPVGYDQGVGVRFTFIFVGAMGVVFGGIAAWLQHQNVQANQALARGEDIIARWRVEAEDWQRFLASDPQWSSHANGRLNEFSPSEAPEPNGVEVIVGKVGVQIGDSIHPLSLRSTPEITEARLHEGAPPVIELLLFYPACATRFGMRPPRYTALRFPVGQAALVDARQVVAHFRGDLGGEPDFFHGRGDGTNPEDLSKCYNCGYETHRFRSHCPQCGTSLQSRRWSRRFGLGLVLCGAIICGLMGYVVWEMGPALLNPGSSRTRFSGTPSQARMILAIFGAVLAFGLTALGYGLWQMFTGRRSKRVIYFVVALAALLLLLAYVL
ncbi:MAG: hypothetical protein ABIR71_11650 [Chthoniobacterales bacterium]